MTVRVLKWTVQGMRELGGLGEYVEKREFDKVTALVELILSIEVSMTDEFVMLPRDQWAAVKDAAQMLQENTS